MFVWIPNTLHGHPWEETGMRNIMRIVFQHTHAKSYKSVNRVPREWRPIVENSLLICRHSIFIVTAHNRYKIIFSCIISRSIAQTMSTSYAHISIFRITQPTASAWYYVHGSIPFLNRFFVELVLFAVFKFFLCNNDFIEITALWLHDHKLPFYLHFQRY